MYDETILSRKIHGLILFLLTLLLGSVPELWATASQVTQLQAKHIAGQTFLTWREVEPPVTQDTMSVPKLLEIRKSLSDKKQLFYRIYRAPNPITSLNGLHPLAEVDPLSCWNSEYYGIYPKPADQALRYVIEEGQPPLTPGTGLYVHNPSQNGSTHYAVTVVLDGKENTTIGPNNTLQTAVKEAIGQGSPILQRVVQPSSFHYINKPTLHYYVRWEAPPNASVENKPFDYIVAVPHTVAEPAPVGIHLHGWGGNLHSGYGWWYNAEKGAILIASNQIPYDWWTGYHERLWTGQALQTQQDWQRGKIQAFTQKRLLSFLDWVATQWKVDLTRTFVAGNSMGGSGAIMLALRFPQRIAWGISWVGIHVPSKSPQFESAYRRIYGKPEWKIEFEDGTPVWDYFNDVWYLRKFPAKETAFITFSNGKNDNGIGWPQAVEFFQALQDTKRAHIFVWGQHGHGQRARMPLDEEGVYKERIMPIDIRTDQSLPAFTQSSLDDDPGGGDPKDGALQGQVNWYLYWTTHDITDENNRWEMTIGVSKKSPITHGTVNVTPRRCQKFQARPGEHFTWTNTSVADRRVVQSGQAVADEWGLVTLEQVIVSQGKNRLLLMK